LLCQPGDTTRVTAWSRRQLGLPSTKVGAFTQSLYDKAQKDGWTVISVKNDWNRVFAFEQ